jgi:hypothetical protein
MPHHCSITDFVHYQVDDGVGPTASISIHLFKGQYHNQLLQAHQNIGNDDAFFGTIRTTLTEPKKPVGPAMASMEVLMDENVNSDPQSDIPSFRTRDHTSLLDH